MIYKFVISLALCAAIKTSTALICHDYVCDGRTCYGEGGTCDSGNKPCQVLKKVNFGEETTTFTCSNTENCVSSAGNTTYDGLTMSVCCNTDLCNDGLSGDPLEEDQKYCYNVGCYGAGCSDRLTQYLDVNKIGAFCKANENGCEITKVKHMDPLTGEMAVEESLSCAAIPCFPVNQDMDEMHVKLDCCKGHLCNKDNSKPDPSKDYCHVYMCGTPPCLSMEEAIAQDHTSLCEMTEKGCYYSNMTDLANNREMISSGCVGDLGGIEECIPQTLVIQDIDTTVKCCYSDKCNDGSKFSGNKDVDPTKNYCHVYECISTSCMPLSDAIKAGRTGFCEMTNLGCFTQTVASAEGTMIHSGCVGLTPEVTQCTPTSMEIDGSKSTTACCNKDRCNNGMQDTDKEDLDPNKNYCHTYSCVSSPLSPCLSLSEAIEQGKTSVCEMSSKGCFVSTFATSGETSILAGCIGVEHMTPECEDTSYVADDMETIQKCCSTDRCNHDHRIDTVVDKPYCHVYLCESSSPEMPCLSLSDAIKMGKTVKCEKFEQGCFAMTGGLTSTVAGCLGDLYGIEECPIAPPVEGAKVRCCGASGCNDRLYQDSDPGTNKGSAVTGMTRMMIAVVMTLCYSLFL